MASFRKRFTAPAYSLLAGAVTTSTTSLNARWRYALKNPLEFQEDVIGLINKHFPRAMKGDIDQNSACAAQLALAMGGILAFAFRMNGEVIGRTVLQTMIKAIIENATAIDAKAGETIRQSLPKIAPTIQ